MNNYITPSAEAARIQKHDTHRPKKREYKMEESDNDTRYDSSLDFTHQNIAMSAQCAKILKNRKSKIIKNSLASSVIIKNPGFDKFNITSNAGNISIGSNSAESSDSDIHVDILPSSPRTSFPSDDIDPNKCFDTGSKVAIYQNNLSRKKLQEHSLGSESKEDNVPKIDRIDMKTANEIELIKDIVITTIKPRKHNTKIKSNTKNRVAKLARVSKIGSNKDNAAISPKRTQISWERKITIGASIVSACLGFAAKYSEVFSAAK